MGRSLWTPRAEKHLEDIAHYIAVDDGRPITAERIVREIHDTCELYARNPLLGEARPDLGNDVRVFSHKRWVIVRGRRRFRLCYEDSIFEFAGHVHVDSMELTVERGRVIP